MARTYQELTDLYKNWISLHQSRTELYLERIEAAASSLQEDIDIWKTALPPDQDNRLVYHHVEQFEKFAQAAKDALDPRQSNMGAVDPEIVDFLALVVGVFTAQWLLLRDVAQQRINGSPYREGLRELDEKAKENYARLYHVLEPKLHIPEPNERYRAKPLASFAPLVHLGTKAQLTVFNRRVPLMISVPFAALSSSKLDEKTRISVRDKTRMAIPHEVSHAVFTQVPEVIGEIQRKLREQLDHEHLPRRERVLCDLVIQWTEEICADLFGTALEGEDYVESAQWVMASSDSMTGVADEFHPPTLLRPIIHLLALSSIERKLGGTKFEKIRRFFEQRIKNVKEPMPLRANPSRQFRSVPALMFVRMETFGDILTKMIERMLGLELDTLNKVTIESLLYEIYSSPLEEDKISEVLKHEFERWGEDARINSEDFVLDFPAATVPTFAIPGVSFRPLCCNVPILNALCTC